MTIGPLWRRQVRSFGATAVLCALTLILSACGGGGGSPGRLIVESRITDEGQTELIVSVDGRVARQPELATSAPRVGILCTDRRGRTTLAARHPWPFPEEPGFLFAHVHQPASPDQIERTSRCRLTGTKVVIEGEGP